MKLVQGFKSELTNFINKQVIIKVKDGEKIRGVLIGMQEDNSCIVGNCEIDGIKHSRVFLNGDIIAYMTLGEEPFDIDGLRMELEKVFRKSGVRYFADSRTIVVMDRFKVTEDHVEGEGPIADRIKAVWLDFKKKSNKE